MALTYDKTIGGGLVESGITVLFYAAAANRARTLNRLYAVLSLSLIHI